MEDDCDGVMGIVVFIVGIACLVLGMMIMSTGSTRVIEKETLNKICEKEYGNEYEFEKENTENKSIICIAKEKERERMEIGS